MYQSRVLGVRLSESPLSTHTFTIVIPQHFTTVQGRKYTGQTGISVERGTEIAFIIRCMSSRFILRNALQSHHFVVA